MNTNPINICLCTKDDKFIKYCASLLESLYRTRDKNSSYNIYILWGDISINTKNRLNKFNDETFNLIFVPIDEKNAFAQYPDIRKKDYIFLYRLFISDYIKEDKIIYMDCDIIINWDLSELYSIDLLDNVVWAVKDWINRSLYWPFKLKSFFNSWVLLINLKKWNQENIGHKVLKLLNDHRNEFPMWQDQDWLNHILQDKRLPISPQWNWIAINTFSNVWTPYTKKEFHEAKHPIIIHYAGTHYRPRGGRLCLHPKWYLYYYYIFKTNRRDRDDVYRLPLRIVISHPITYFMFKVARLLFNKGRLQRKFKTKIEK